MKTCNHPSRGVPFVEDDGNIITVCEACHQQLLAGFTAKQQLTVNLADLRSAVFTATDRQAVIAMLLQAANHLQET